MQLRTRPPVGEQGEEVGRADGAVAVEVGGAAFARPPTCEQCQQVGCADGAVVVEIPGAGVLDGDPGGIDSVFRPFSV